MKLFVIEVQDNLGSVHECSVFDNDTAALEFNAECRKQYGAHGDDWSFSYTEVELNKPLESLRGITFV